jgi:UDP-glucose 4-epimerase
MVELKGLNIVVTGGAGFIGKHLVDELIVNNNVTVIDNLSSGSEDAIRHYFGKENLTFVKGDILTQRLVRDVLDGKDIVFHLAAMSEVDGGVRQSDKIYNNNLGGTVNLLREFNGELFVFTSLVEVGVTGLNPYIKSKYMAEWAIKKSKKPYVVLRLANVYGKGSRSVVQKFIESEEIRIFGDGKQVRDFVFVSDVVDHLVRVLDMKRDSIYNVGSGVRTTVNQLAGLVGRIVGEKTVEYVPMRESEFAYPVVDVDLLCQTGLEEGIRRSLLSR